MNLNYTCICWYCGEIYQANRSTSKYCCTKHNSLYHANGSNIDYSILNSQEQYVSYHDVLSKLYKVLSNSNTWTRGCSINEVKEDFKYNGPLPDADEVLFVSGFLIQKQYRSHKLFDYYFKPMYFLSKHEKASKRLIKPELYILYEDY